MEQKGHSYTEIYAEEESLVTETEEAINDNKECSTEVKTKKREKRIHYKWEVKVTTLMRKRRIGQQKTIK